MMKTEKKLIDDIVRDIGSGSFIQLVYIFGSTVRGGDRKPSDVDVAVLYEGALNADERLNLQLIEVCVL